MSFNLVKIKGIRIRIHWSFTLLFFGLIAGIALTAGEKVAILYGIGFLGLFAAVTIHELVHSLTAQYFGYPVHEILLYPLGGMAKIEEMPQDSKEEFLISLFGPLTNFIIAGLVYGVSFAVKAIEWTAFQAYFGNPLEHYMVIYAVLNMWLGVFNLFIPAIPMDGGRLLRSLLAIKMPYVKATRISVQVSKVVAFIMGIIGFFTNLWLVLIAIFIYTASSGELEQSIIRYLLGDTKIETIMSKDLVSVNPELTINEFLDYMIEQGHLGYTVSDDQGNYLGVVTLSDARGVEPELRDKIQVGQIMHTDVLSIKKGENANEALKLMKKNNIGRVFVEDPDRPKQYLGIVTRSDLIKFLQIAGVKEGIGRPTRNR